MTGKTQPSSAAQKHHYVAWSYSFADDKCHNGSENATTCRSMKLKSKRQMNCIKLGRDRSLTPIRYSLTVTRLDALITRFADSSSVYSKQTNRQTNTKPTFNFEAIERAVLRRCISPALPPFHKSLLKQTATLRVLLSRHPFRSGFPTKILYAFPINVFLQPHDTVLRRTQGARLSRWFP
jgi:hypothetical protein